VGVSTSEFDAATPASPSTAGDARRLILSGVAWKGVAQVSIQATRLLVAITLARLLAPHDYGLAGMVLVFSSFALIFSDLALGQTLVQRRVITEADASTVFWTSVGSGLIFTLVGVALSGPISAFFGEPVLQPMIAVFSLSFLIWGVGLTQSAMLVRNMAFRSLEIRQIAATMIGGIVGIAVALDGHGAWAIVCQQLAGAAAATLLVWRFSTWRPRWMYSLPSLRGFAGFSANVLGTNVLTQLRPITANVLIGRFLGASALGAYALAYNVMLVPFGRIAEPLAQVLFPALSRSQDDREQIVKYWLRAARLLAALAMPALLGLIVVASDFVEVVLGHDWARATPVIQLLAVVGLLQTLQFLNPVLLQAIDRTSTLLAWSAGSFAVSLVAFAIGLHWGIVGVAAAFAIAAAASEPFYTWLVARAVGISVSTFVSNLSGIAQATAVMVGALLAARLLMINAGVTTSARLILLIGLGMVTFAATALWRAQDVIADVKSLRKERPRQPQVEGAA
jgi:O-antigen/teichoic acid export membrane protein